METLAMMMCFDFILWQGKCCCGTELGVTNKGQPVTLELNSGEDVAEQDFHQCEYGRIEFVGTSWRVSGTGFAIVVVTERNTTVVTCSKCKEPTEFPVKLSEGCVALNSCCHCGARFNIERARP